MQEKSYICNNITSKIDKGLLRELIEEWNSNHRDAFYTISTDRETYTPVLEKTNTYHLRSPFYNIRFGESTLNQIYNADEDTYKFFPTIKRFIKHVGDKLYSGWKYQGRVMITRLENHSEIPRHIDRGLYYNHMNRFHLPLKTGGSIFCWDEHSQPLLENNLYLVNNSIPHWVENPNNSQRTHLLFDGF